MKIDNKEVIQSYLLTTAKYDFSVHEKRILYRLVEMVQYALEGKKLNAGYKIKELPSKDRVITMPISAFLQNEMDENYTRVKKALRDLRNKTFEYDDGQIWQLIGIIEKPNFDRAGWVEFELQPKVFDAILNFSQGFRKYELKTAMGFESHYSMRFYEIFSNQNQVITYNISTLKTMFGIDNKYKGRPADFIRRVIIPAKKELDEKSPYSFNYKEIKEGRKIVSILFTPVFIKKNQDPELELEKLKKQTSVHWDLDRLIINYLRQNLLFTDNEIKNNRDLFKQASEELDLIYELSVLQGRARNKKNPKGYIINALKAILGD